MKQLHLACPGGLRFNPLVDNINIAHPAGLDSIWSHPNGVANNPTITKFVMNPMKTIYQKLISAPSAISLLILRGESWSLDNGFPRVIDAASLNQNPCFEQRPKTLKDLKLVIQSILSTLRIPIFKKFVDHVAMEIENTNENANESSEDWLNNIELIILDALYSCKDRRIRDPLHNLIEFTDDEFGLTLWKIIQTPIFQRLRRIKQLGFSEFVYPGATHNRFLHCIGVYFNACRLFNKLQKKLGKKFNEQRAEVAIAAALLHDIGHGPFSHAFESVGKILEFIFAEHETVSEEIILKSEITSILNEYREGLAVQVADMVVAKIPSDIYASIVSSQFDADRLDYLERDQLMTGSQNSRIDLTWLISNIEIRTVQVEIEPSVIKEVETIVFNSKAKLALQTYIFGLFNLYNSVYFHPVTRAAEQVFKHLLLRMHKLLQRGEMNKIALPANNPIICFFQNPDSLENALKLNDNVIETALDELMNSEDQIVSKLAFMLKNRRLPKAFDVRERVKQYFQGDEFEGLSKKKRNKLIDDSVWKFKEQLQDYIKKPNIGELVWLDSGSRTAYKSIGKKPGKLDAIQVLENGKVFGIEELSESVEVIKEYKFERVYLPFENSEISDYLNSLITTCCKEVFQNGMSSNK